MKTTQNSTDNGRRGFLKGLMASFLVPVAAKNAIAEPPVIPKVKLEDYYDSQVLFCSGAITGEYKSIFNYSGSFLVSG